MNRQEQIDFVKDLLGKISEDVIRKIESEQIPDDWNGLQLRKFLADKFSDEVLEMKRTAKWKYKNDVLINQL